MKIYCAFGKDVDPQYFSSKRAAIRAAKWEYHERMNLYGCNQWYREGVCVADVSVTKSGVIDALNDKLTWDTVQEPKWMP